MKETRLEPVENVEYNCTIPSEEILPLEEVYGGVLVRQKIKI